MYTPDLQLIALHWLIAIQPLMFGFHFLRNVANCFHWHQFHPVYMATLAPNSRLCNRTVNLGFSKHLKKIQVLFYWTKKHIKSYYTQICVSSLDFNQFKFISARIQLWSMKHYLEYFIQRREQSRSTGGKVIWRLNPPWTNNVCTNSLAVQQLVVETRLKRTDWLLCFTLKKFDFFFCLCCLKGALHHKQKTFPKKTSSAKTQSLLCSARGIITNIFINLSQMLVCCFSNTLFAALSESRDNCCVTRPGRVHSGDPKLDNNGVRGKEAPTAGLILCLISAYSHTNLH